MSRIILVGNCGSGWDSCALPDHPPMLGPSSGDHLFGIIRQKRVEGLSFADACQFVRREYPQLLPEGSKLGIH